MTGFQFLFVSTFYQTFRGRSTSHHVSGQATILDHLFLYTDCSIGQGVGNTMEAQGNSRHWEEIGDRRQGNRKGRNKEKKANGIFGGNTTEDRTYQTNPRKEKRRSGKDFGKEGNFSPLPGNSICSVGACEDLQRSSCS
ncbi:hypothetical protein CTAM01_03126 [Colletotrichum tamarilloi]|uniref:Uncharacterized protein n=1 Tax=Colletotrichum tamarilloi TaxID=1209934 RepID=A0ABQ9RL48_9PEZI|nr:uncharacterized protein CTAM01_03126 [Colletotrichum tamarilloi]KAK1506794.1 hypothetical protein CTAM01_03126 [Colletotrichum tamarilloi]